MLVCRMRITVEAARMWKKRNRYNTFYMSDMDFIALNIWVWWLTKETSLLEHVMLLNVGITIPHSEMLNRNLNLKLGLNEVVKQSNGSAKNLFF